MKILSLLLATTVLATACSKSKSEDTPPTPEKEMEGYWTGHYTSVGSIAKENYAMLFKPNGQLRVYDLGAKTDTSAIHPLAKSDGTRVLSGQTVQTTYKSGSFTYNTIATVNADKSEMTGSWIMNDSPKGNIFLSR